MFHVFRGRSEQKRLKAAPFEARSQIYAALITLDEDGRNTPPAPSTTRLGNAMQARNTSKGLPFPAGRPLSVTFPKTPARSGAGPDYRPRGMGSSQ